MKACTIHASRVLRSLVQEFEEGINAVAAPILDQNGFPIAAIAIAGPAFRLTPERMLAIGPVVRAIVDEMAQEIQMGTNPDLNGKNQQTAWKLKTSSAQPHSYR